jgi:hypothetical protein
LRSNECGEGEYCPFSEEDYMWVDNESVAENRDKNTSSIRGKKQRAYCKAENGRK